MAYSNGRFSSTGRFSAPSPSQTRAAEVAYRDEVASFDPLDEIRDEYKRLTTTLANRSDDVQAFEECSSRFGFGKSVKALKRVSKYAGEKAAQYRARMERERGGR